MLIKAIKAIKAIKVYKAYKDHKGHKAYKGWLRSKLCDVNLETNLVPKKWQNKLLIMKSQLQCLG